MECFRPLIVIAVAFILLWVAFCKWQRNYAYSPEISKVQTKKPGLDFGRQIKQEVGTSDNRRLIDSSQGSKLEDRISDGKHLLMSKQHVKKEDGTTDTNRSLDSSQLIGPSLGATDANRLLESRQPIKQELGIAGEKTKSEVKTEHFKNERSTSLLRQQADEKLKELNEEVGLTLLFLEKDKLMFPTCSFGDKHFTDDSVAKSDLLSMETDESSVSDQKWVELEAVESESPSALQSKPPQYAHDYYYVGNESEQPFGNAQELSDQTDEQQRLGTMKLQKKIQWQEQASNQSQRTFREKLNLQRGETDRRDKSAARGSMSNKMELDSRKKESSYPDDIPTKTDQRKKTRSESKPLSVRVKMEPSSFTEDVSDMSPTAPLLIAEHSIQTKKGNGESNGDGDIPYGTSSGTSMPLAHDIGVDNGLWNKISSDAETTKQLSQDAERFLDELRITSQANQSTLDSLLDNVTTNGQSSDFLANIGPVPYDSTCISPLRFGTTPNLQLKISSVQSPAKFTVACDCMTFDITTTHTPSLCPTPETSCPCLELARKLVDDKLSATELLLHQSDMFQKRLKETITPPSGPSIIKLKSDAGAGHSDASCSPNNLERSDGRITNKALDEYLKTIQGHCKCFPKEAAEHQLCCEWHKKLKKFFSERTWEKSIEDLPTLISQTLVREVLESVLGCNPKQYSTDRLSSKPSLVPRGRLSEESDSGYRSVAQRSDSTIRKELKTTPSILRTGGSAHGLWSSPSKPLKKQISFATMNEDIGVSSEWRKGEHGNIQGQSAGPKTRTHHDIEQTASHLVEVIVKESISTFLKPQKESCQSLSQDGVNINNAHSSRSVSSNSSDIMLSFMDKIKRINKTLEEVGKGANVDKAKERRESIKQEFQNADNVAQMINHFGKQKVESVTLPQSPNLEIFEKQLRLQQEEDRHHIINSTECHSSRIEQHEKQSIDIKQEKDSASSTPRKASKERKRQSYDRQKSRNKNTSARSSDRKKHKRKMAGCSSSSENSPLFDARDKHVLDTTLRRNFDEGYSLTSLVASTEDSDWKWLGISDARLKSGNSQNEIQENSTNSPTRMPRQKKSVHYEDDSSSKNTNSTGITHCNKGSYKLTPEQQERILGPEKDYMLDIPNLAYHKDCQRCNDFMKGSYEYQYSPHFKPCQNDGHVCIRREHFRTPHGKTFEYQDRQLQCSSFDDEPPSADIDMSQFKEPTKLTDILDVSKSLRRERYRYYFRRHQNSTSNAPRDPLCGFDHRGRSYDQKGTASWTVKTIGSYSTPNNTSLTWNDLARQHQYPAKIVKVNSSRIC